MRGYPCLFLFVGFHLMGNGEGWFQIPSVKAGLHGSDSEPQFFIFFNVPDLMTAVARVKNWVARQMRRDPTNLASDVSVPAEILKAASVYSRKG